MAASEELRKSKALLTAVDRYIHDHLCDPPSLTPEQRVMHADLLNIQAELTRFVHAPEQMVEMPEPVEPEPKEPADAADTAIAQPVMEATRAI